MTISSPQTARTKDGCKEGVFHKSQMAFFKNKTRKRLKAVYKGLCKQGSRA